MSDNQIYCCLAYFLMYLLATLIYTSAKVIDDYIFIMFDQWLNIMHRLNGAKNGRNEVKGR